MPRYLNFYPRSPCGERPHSAGPWQAEYMISIHALLAESDPLVNMRNTLSPVFLSTLSLRRATVSFMLYDTTALIFLSTLSLRRATSVVFLLLGAGVFLSTLSLRRATAGPFWPGHFCCNFYPRSPCGERRYRISARYTDRAISIHALLAESDMLHEPWHGVVINFYPRSPCGERP